jgi:NTP pyrophosphatase (non-canonical NTP hydrolase)
MKNEGPYSIGSDHWNGLSKLVEELGELGQVLGKLMGSGGNTNHWSGDLNEKLIEELGDVAAAMNFFITKNMNEDQIERIINQADKKETLFEEWNIERR